MNIQESNFDILGIDKDFKGNISTDMIQEIKKIYQSLDLSIINEKNIDKAISLAHNFSVKNIFCSLLFTYIWKKSNFENRNLLFQLLDSEKYRGISCLNNEYALLATRAKYRRSDMRKQKIKREEIYIENKKTNPDFSNTKKLFISLKTICSLKIEDQNIGIKKFFEEVLKRVENTKDTDKKAILLAEYLLCFPHTTILNNNISLLSIEKLGIFNVEKITEINRFINYYITEKQLLNEKERFRTLSYLSFYINFYLPISYYLKLTDIEPINSLDEFKGSYFVSTPLPLKKKLPLSLLKFLDIAAGLRSENEVGFKYTILNNIKEFFDEIISRREAYNIKENFSNPILTSNLPKINKLKESSKTRMPSEVFWLFLGVSKKVIKIVEQVNSSIINGKMTPNLLRNYIINDELDLNLLKTKITLDTEFQQNNKKINIQRLRREIFSFTKYKLKSGRFIEIITPLPLIQIAVALETGLRHQSIQWLSDDFDKNINVNTIIDENELYELFVKTDKSKKTSWCSFVSGRVINLLRSARDFKELLNEPAFNEKIPYDGHGKNWGSYKILFNFNPKNGLPFSDNLYTNRFKSLLCCVEDLLVDIDFDYKIYKNEKDRKNLSCEITPHSTRVTIVSELVNYLPPEYISRHITGHSAQTVTYYTKYDKEDIKKFKIKQKDNFNKRNSTDTLALSSINTIDSDSNIVKSFKINYEMALDDFGCSTIDEDAWLNIIDKKIEPNFSFESTHICPFSSVCPKIVLEKKIDHKCFKCPYAIRSIDHLPALCAKRREIIEIITSIEDKLIENKLTNLKKLQLQEKRKELAEELAYYSVIIEVIDKKLVGLKEGRESYTTFKPEALKNELIKGYFPADSDTMYVINRLEEVNNYPDFESPEINAKIKYLTTKILVATGNIRNLMKEEYHGEKSSLHAYSLLKSLISSKQITYEDLIGIVNTDVNDLKLIDKTFLLEKKHA